MTKEIEVPESGISRLTFPLSSACPTPPVASAGMSLNLDEEARLYTSNAEREKYESLATLYGIIISLDFLERAYIRDSITAAE